MRRAPHKSVLGLIALSCVSTVVVPVSANESAPATALSEQERAAIDALFKDYDKPEAPGCAMGVMRAGQMAYARGYGMADLERQIPITLTTPFDVGSTSKQFTAGAIVTLAIEGKLSLTDDVRKHIPELPDYGTTITIDHLLRHTSGLRDYIELLSLAGVSLEEISTDAQALAIIGRQRNLNFRPGTRYDYSNSGYFLLSLIVQRVSGQSLAQFVRERFFAPLHMERTLIRDDYAMLVPGRALGYGPQENGGFALSFSNWEQTGDGAVQISVEDAMKWAANLHDPRVGGAKFVSLLEENGKLDNGEAIDYARGLFVDEYRGLRRVQHGGAWIGYRANLVRFPQQQVAIAVFCNRDGSRPQTLTGQITDIVLAGQLRKEPSPRAAKNPRGTAPAPERLVGTYFADDDDSIMKIVHAEGVLALQAFRGTLPLQPTGAATFALQDYPGTIEFTLPSRGPASAFELRFEGAPAVRAGRITPATPQVAQLQAYVGTFHSEELDGTWPIFIEEGKLAIRRTVRKFTPEVVTLEPAMPDTFNGSIGFLRFSKDVSGRVTGFDLSSARMRGIRFEARP
jgi:CubicO group peptidase (beta-lactamase class C family)